MILCLFIHDFSKIIEWLFKSMINKESNEFKVQIYRQFEIYDMNNWRNITIVKFNKNISISIKIQISCSTCCIQVALFLYQWKHIRWHRYRIKVFNLCWLSSKNNVQLMIKDFLLKESNMLSSWIKKIFKHSSIAFLTWIFNFSNLNRQIRWRNS